MTQPLGPNDLITRIRFELDESARKKVSKAYADLKTDIEAATDPKQVEALGKRFAEIAIKAKLPRDVFEQLEHSLREAGVAGNRITDELAAGFRKAYDEAEKLNQSAQQLAQERFDLISQQVGLAGDIQSNLGAINALSGGAVGPVGEVFALIEELPRLKTAFQGLPATISAAASAVGPSGVLVAGALTLMAISIANFVQQAEERAAALKAAVEANRDVGRDIAEGATTEDLQARLEEIDRLRQQEVEELERTQEAYRALIAGFDDLGLATLSKVFSAEEEALATSIADIENSISSFNSEAAAIEAALRDGETAANDAAVAEEELAATRQQALADLQQAQAQLAALEQQRADSVEDYNRSLQQTFEDRQRASIREEEDFNRSIEQIRENGLKRVEAIEEAGAKRIEAIRKQLSDLPAKQAEEQQKALADYNRERAELERDYNDERLKREQDFRRRQSDEEEKSARDRQRLVEDNERRLNEARANLDAEAFLQAKLDSKRELRRFDEDAEAAAEQREEEFTREQQERQEQRDKKLEELRQELQAERAEIARNYAERRAQLNEQLAQEQTALKESVAAAYEAIKEAENAAHEARLLRLKRQQEDQDVADRRREEAHQREMEALSQQQRAIIETTSGTNVLTRAAQQFSAAATRAQSTVAALMNSLSRSRNTSGGGGSGSGGAPAFSGRGSFTAFANGGLVTKPTLAVLGENGPEMAIPVFPSNGLNADASRILGMMGGTRGMGREPITLNFTDSRSIFMDDFASKQSVADVLKEYDDYSIKRIIKAVEEVVYGGGR